MPSPSEKYEKILGRTCRETTELGAPYRVAGSGSAHIFSANYLRTGPLVHEMETRFGRILLDGLSSVKA